MCDVVQPHLNTDDLSFTAQVLCREIKVPLWKFCFFVCFIVSNVWHVFCNNLHLFCAYFVSTMTLLVADGFTSFRKFSVFRHWYSVPFHYINEELLFNNSHSVKSIRLLPALMCGTKALLFFQSVFFHTSLWNISHYIQGKVTDLTCSSPFFFFCL